MQDLNPTMYPPQAGKSRYPMSSRFLFLPLIALLILAGCSPSLAPLYKDYEIHDTDEDIQERIANALTEAGWELSEDSISPKIILTEERTINRRLVYKTIAKLEVVPIEDSHVRVLIHPYRDNLIGLKSKLPYLPGNIQRQIVPPITELFKEAGLYTIGAAPPDSVTASAR